MSVTVVRVSLVFTGSASCAIHVRWLPGAPDQAGCLAGNACGSKLVGSSGG